MPAPALNATNWKLNWPVLAIVIYTGLLASQLFNFVTSDLGRHIQNGRVILDTGQVFATNLYSYTSPQFAAINHHWLFGVLMAALEPLVGIPGLSVIGVTLLMGSVALTARLTLKSYSPAVTALALFIALPLICLRVEIRPELFSLFFVALYRIILDHIEEVGLTKRTALTLLVTQVIWTNLHLFFIFGPILVGYSWLRSAHSPSRFKHIGLLLAGTTLVTLINPHFWQGVVAPLLIFENYGYQIAENQTLWFIANRTHEPVYFYGLLVISLVLIGTVMKLIGQKKALLAYLPTTLIICCFGGLALAVNRALPFIGLLVVPALAEWLASALPKLTDWRRRTASHPGWLSGLSLLGFGGMAVILSSGIFTPKLARYGLGAAPGHLDAITFFKQQRLSGPIFNNYDNGGYLIYYLYPSERVFVDNRPEAYPVDFFEQTYIAAQESETRWKELEEEHQFNVIFFYRHDMTPWAQPFLVRRLDDPTWVPIYVDGYSLILIKNKPEHTPIIDQWRISRDRFTVVK